MGVEVELGVGSDTGTLRGGSGGRREGLAVRDEAAKDNGLAPYPRPRKWPLGVLFAASLIACGRGDGALDAGAGSASSPERAEALIAGAPLPERLETVALADAVALASNTFELPKDASYEFKYVVDGIYVNEPEADSLVWNEFAGSENGVLAL